MTTTIEIRSATVEDIPDLIFVVPTAEARLDLH